MGRRKTSSAGGQALIRTPTTFVIGAGASRPYGLPLGADLLEQARSLHLNDDLFRLLISLPMEPGGVLRFIEDIKETPTRSIDDYLAKRQHDSDFMKIGRAVIAGLMGRAIASQKAPKPNEDWLGQIIEWMSTGANTRSAFEKGNSSVRFVTFNFDSNIENRLVRDVHWLYRSLDARPITDVVETIHVHGQLPDAPPLTGDALGRTPLGDLRQSIEWLTRAVGTINVVIDPIRDEVAAKARRALIEARIVCFLGFGYSDDNLGKLGIPGPTPIDGKRHVFGSALGVPDGYQDWIRDRFGRRVLPDGTIVQGITLGESHDDCLQTLQKFHIYRD